MATQEIYAWDTADIDTLSNELATYSNGFATFADTFLNLTNKLKDCYESNEASTVLFAAMEKEYQEILLLGEDFKTFSDIMVKVGERYKAGETTINNACTELNDSIKSIDL